MAEALARFCRFGRKNRPARDARNPRIGERIVIGPSPGAGMALTAVAEIRPDFSGFLSVWHF
ncbi:MAG: hypothetical protein OXG71_03150 [Rhodospirillales bacterium]|nr:hypothetical protein [Rhodospirillales bacterium]